MSLAAGCTTSSSRNIVAASEVKIIFWRWFMTILLRPKGPREVWTVWAIEWHAVFGRGLVFITIRILK